MQADVSNEYDDLDLLVSSWHTHLTTPCESKPLAPSVTATYPLRALLDECPPTHHALAAATYFSRVCARHNMTETAPVESLHRGCAADTLWLLSLVCRNKDLMKATTQLVVLFQERYAALCHQHHRQVDALRASHQKQLIALLDVPASTTSVIVDSSVTEHVVMRHAHQLRQLQRQCRTEARALETSQQRDLHAFLYASAPDAVARLGETRSSTVSHGDVYQPEVDVSRFAEQDATTWMLPRHAEKRSDGVVGSAPADVTGRPPTSRRTARPVAPVRTVQLSNPLVRAFFGPASAHASALNRHTAGGSGGTRDRQSHAAMPPIVLDVSPSSWLPSCLCSSCSTHLGNDTNEASSTAVAPPRTTTVAAIDEHLMRLARGRTSMLLLIATEAVATEVVTSVPSPELFFTDQLASGALHNSDEWLDESAAEDDMPVPSPPPLFTPLTQCPHLKALYSTRLWGANVVLLYTPPSFVHPDDANITGADTNGGSAAANNEASTRANVSAFDVTPPVVEDALRLAFAWGVDMFSVAVLDATPMASLDFPRTTVFSRSASVMDVHGPDRSPAHGVSAQVLSQLQRGLAEKVLQHSQVKASSVWRSADEDALLDCESPSVGAAGRCPRTVGTRYHGVGAAAKTSVAKLGGFSPMGPSLLSVSPTAPDGTGTPFSSTSAATFNTPMAIRVFLPLPEAFFAPASPVDVLGTTAQNPSLAGETKASRSPGRAGSQSREGHLRDDGREGASPFDTVAHTSFTRDHLHNNQGQLRYHSSTLDRREPVGGVRRSNSHTAVGQDDDAPGLKAFLYYACGEGACVL